MRHYLVLSLGRSAQRNFADLDTVLINPHLPQLSGVGLLAFRINPNTRTSSDIPFREIAPALAQAYAELKMSDICFPRALLNSL